MEYLQLQMIPSLREVPGEPGSLVTALAIIAFVITVMIVVLLLLSVTTRLVREQRKARERRFRERWQPVLYARMAGDSLALPLLAPGERLMFLALFLETLGYVRDEAADALTAAANELELEQFVLRSLRGRSTWKRVIAVRAAAALRLPEAVAPLERAIAEGSTRDALDAAAALFRIEAKRGLDALAPLLAQEYWSPGVVAALLQRCAVPATPVLAGLLRSPPPGGVKQVVRLIEMLGYSDMLPDLRALLEASSDSETLAALLHALGSFGSASERLTAIRFLDHPEWIVRMQAAVALGRLGTNHDAPRLTPLLRDRSWWVRYRAAQSLLRLSGTAGVRSAAERESDRYARDILLRAVAEGA